MTDPGKDSNEEIPGAAVVALENSSPDRAAIDISYAHRADAGPAEAWLKWMAIVVGAWLLIATFPSTRFWFREIGDLIQDARGYGPPLHLRDAALRVWSIGREAMVCAAALGLVVLARRRVAVGNLAVGLVLVSFVDIAITVLLHIVNRNVVSAVRPPSSVEVMLYSVHALRAALLPAILWLASIRTSGLPWRWCFRLGWWMSLLFVLQILGMAINYASIRAADTGLAAARPTTLFHVEPTLAVRLLAAVFVLATLRVSAPSPRQAALFGGLGLLVIAGGDAYPRFSSAVSSALYYQSFYGLLALVGVCAMTLVPAIVLAINWKRLPETVAVIAEPADAA
jgi:hypothetical protein